MKANKNVLILFFSMIVVMLGFGLVIPILPFYVKSFGAGGSELGALMSIYGILQFIFAPIWGGLSDRYGRKPILMLGILGNAISQLLFGLSTQLWMLFAARTMAGMLSSATLPTAMAYIGDSTSEDERGGGMGMIGAAMGIGMVLGPGMGGLLAGRSLSLPFFLAAALSMAALILVAVTLPEAPQKAASQPGKKSSRLAALTQALVGPLGVLFFMAFLLSFGLTNFEGVFGLYAADQYGYGPQQVGLLLMMIGVISAAIQGALAGRLIRRWGEVRIIRVSLFTTAVFFVLLTQASNTIQVILTVSGFIFSNAMLNPSVASLVSKRAVEGQGVTMGLNNAFLSLGRIFGPLWAGWVYDINFRFPYLTGAAITAGGFLISLWGLAMHPGVTSGQGQPAEQEGV